jgi:pimeloyl-ACP methyl ester carboxylesterase
MSTRTVGLSPLRIALAVLAIALIVLSWFQIPQAQRGLVSRSIVVDGLQMRYLAAEGAVDAPGVVIAHGFSGSKELMLGFGYALARAGYGALLFDFAGHGSSSGRLDREGGSLAADVATATRVLQEQQEVDPSKIALLGHSMGSGAVMSAGIDHAEDYRAVVAVSPTGADVSADVPRNLLLMAGTLEPQFLANARDLLAAAGGPNEQVADGLGRSLVPIQNVEHITILFSPAARQAALDWLNRVFARPPQSVSADSRMPWYGAHLVGWLLLMVALSPAVPKGAALPATARRGRWPVVALLIAPFAAALGVAALERLAGVSELGGMLVAGALGVWFLIMGLVWLLLGFRPPRPTGDDVAWGLVLFALLWVAFGLLAQLVWLPWTLIPERLARWPFVAAAALPWLLAAGLVQTGQPFWKRLGWWALQSLLIVAGLGLAVALTPGLFFVVLLMPVIPIILAVMSIAGGAVDRPWSFAIGNALFFGWLLVAVFPLV